MNYPMLLVFPDEPIQMANSAQQRKLIDLTLEKRVLPTLTPSIEDLSTLGIAGPVVRILRDAGLSILVDFCEVPTYTSPTREFISSFERIMEGNIIVGWRFRLGNRTFERTRAEICSLLGFSTQGIIPSCSAEERSAFMRSISPFDRYITYMTPQNIQDVTWKCLHRIIALAINTRLDGGRYLSLSDMDMLVHLSRSTTIDWFSVLTARYLEWGTTLETNPNAPQVLGGGLFITRIATAMSFDMSTAGRAQVHRLTLKLMRSFKMITPDNTALFSDRLVSKAIQRLRGAAPPMIRGHAQQMADEEVQENAGQIPANAAQQPGFEQPEFDQISSSFFPANIEELGFDQFMPAQASPQTSAAGARTRSRSGLSRRVSRMEREFGEMRARQQDNEATTQTILDTVRRIEQNQSGAGPSHRRSRSPDQ